MTGIPLCKPGFQLGAFSKTLIASSLQPPPIPRSTSYSKCFLWHLLKNLKRLFLQFPFAEHAWDILGSSLNISTKLCPPGKDANFSAITNSSSGESSSPISVKSGSEMISSGSNVNGGSSISVTSSGSSTSIRLNCLGCGGLGSSCLV